MSLLRCLPLVLVLFGAACGGEEEPLPILTESVMEPEQMALDVPPTAHERLSRGVVLGLDREQSAISIAVTRSNVVYDARPRALDGELALRVRGGAISLNAIEVELGDVMLPAEEFPPHGVHLTDIVGVLHVAPIKTTWSDDANAVFETHANIRVEWKLVREDGTLEIRPLEIEDVPLGGDLQISEEGIVRVEMRLMAPGVLFEVANVIEMSDLSMTLALSDL